MESGQTFIIAVNGNDVVLVISAQNGAKVN